jgi:predicted lactoylglutathione lyase
MENEFWINLPSKNLAKAKEFFIQLGFTMNDRHQAPHMVSMFIGKQKTVLNLFIENVFQGFIGGLRSPVQPIPMKFYFPLAPPHRKRWTILHKEQ